jgi:RNA polymerase sigma factor (sigma-70 family)
MDAATPLMPFEQNEQIASAVRRERGRLRAFIRRRVLDDGEAEDILQDVLYELVAAYRRLQPLEEVGAWLFRVARNRITDFFRKKRAVPIGGLVEPAQALAVADALDGADAPVLEDLLLPADDAPDVALAREMLLDALAAAIEELPPEQRDVFVAHELEGASFKELAERTGVPLNTLLARKHYAVKHLRRSLQATYDEWLQD